MTLRPPRPAEWSTVLDLLERAGLPTSDLAPAHASRFLIAMDGGAVLGCVGVEHYEDWGLLRSLAVAMGERGRGLGAALLEAAEESARADGARHLVLLTTTAERFFLARGWTQISRDAVPETVRQSSEFGGVCPASAVCLHLRLEGKTAPLP